MWVSSSRDLGSSAEVVFVCVDGGGYWRSAYPGTDPTSIVSQGNGILLCNEMLMNWTGDQHRSSRWNSGTIVPADTREDGKAEALDNLWKDRC